MALPIRAIIVDDEAPARELLRLMCDEIDEIEIVAECADGLRAVESIIDLQPDLVLLDIQMPEFSGFDVIQTVGVENMPVIIFVTAYDRFAMRAFEVHAIDYLLKPFDENRLHTAVAKAIRETALRGQAGHPEQIQSLLTAVQMETPLANRILIRSAGRVAIVRIEQIDWITSAGNYVELHIGEEKHILRETMKNMEQRLDERMFVRIHRTTIVNVDRIKELKVRSYGDYIIILHNGTRLTLSRNYRDHLIERLNDK